MSTRSWSRWAKICLSMFMTLLVICALRLYDYVASDPTREHSLKTEFCPAEGSRVRYVASDPTREHRCAYERRWVGNPLKTEFRPAEGSRVRRDDPLLKVAWISKRVTAHSWVVEQDGRIVDAWHYGYDAGGEPDVGTATREALERLPECLKRLPPSDLAADSTGCLIVAFPGDDGWVIRRYRIGATPKAVHDLAQMLNVRSSTDGRPMETWLTSIPRAR